MTDEKRFRKPEPPRQGPIRNWSTLLGSFTPPGGARQGDGGEPPFSHGATPDSVVSRAVELGYQVIEEQIRQGQRAAEQLSQGRIDPGMVGGNLSEMAERLLRVSSDVAALWLELMNSMVRNPGMSQLFENIAGAATNNSRHSTDRPNGAGNGASHARAPASEPGLAVEIVSSTPSGARVSIDLHSSHDHARLVFSALRARNDDKPPLTEVCLMPASAEWPASLRVTIPAGHPAGTYSGLVIDEVTDEPVGTVCARIPEAAGA